MYDIDEIQIKESKIIIEGESHNDKIARIWSAGLAAYIDNEILLDLMEIFNRCQQAHDAEERHGDDINRGRGE
jgi:hypothetical protein